MRTTILVATILALGGAANASEWGGAWTVEGGGTRTLDGADSSLTLDVTLPVDGDNVSFHLRGGVTGQDKISLQGKGTKTVGVVGAIDRKKGGGTYNAKLEAQLVDGTVSAHFTVGSESAGDEKWYRGKPEIISLESDGKPLSGDFDAKLSETGLVVKYRVPVAMDLTLQVVVGGGHPYASFYAKPEIFEAPLGRVEKGEYTAIWDGRDRTEAARIALGGPYRVVLLAGNEKADSKTFSVAPPRFVTAGSDWKAGHDNAHPNYAWNPTDHLNAVASIALQRPLATRTGMPSPGFAVAAPGLFDDPDKLGGALAKAGSFVLETHGTSGGGSVLVWDGRLQCPRPYAPDPGNLKDVHFAFASCCETDKAAGATRTSFCDKLIAAGCDVVIGYDKEVLIDEAKDFVTYTMMLMTRGDPIAKTAREVKTPGESYPGSSAVTTNSRAGFVKDCMHVRFAKGIPESESLWPPRYGNSKN